MIAIMGAAGAITLSSASAAWAQEERAEKPRPLQDSCIHLNQVRRTVIVDDQTVLFYMTGGRIKKVSLAFPCPSLKFYGSFGYEAYSNRLCARVDTIVSRAGTHCPIGDITTVTPPSDAPAPKAP